MTQDRVTETKQDLIKKCIALEKAIDRNDRATAFEIYNQVKGQITKGQMKRYLDDIYMEKRSRFAPTVNEYKCGLEAVLPKLNDMQLLMLTEHYRSDPRILTAKELAEKCGIDYRMVNRWYGEVAKRLLQEMGYTRPADTGIGDGVWLTGICDWPDPGSFRMLMRPQLAKALQELGMV